MFFRKINYQNGYIISNYDNSKFQKKGERNRTRRQKGSNTET